MFESGHGETFKGCVHLALFSLAAVCGAYSVGCLMSRAGRERRLWMNAGIYTALMAYEARQVLAHAREC